MSGPFLAAFRQQPTWVAYRGPDRRHIIARHVRPVENWWLTAAAVGFVAVLLLVAAFMTASVLGFGAWESGMGDAALIACGGAALLLGLRWRVLGEAMCIPLAAATAVIGLAYVPPTIHVGTNSNLVIGLRLASGAVLVVLVLCALFYEEVRSDLRPVRFVTLTFLVTGLAALPLSVWPLQAIVASELAGIKAWGVAEALIELGIGIVILRAAVRRERSLLVAVAIMLFSVAAASALRAVHPSGWWLDVAAACLLAGAVGLVVAAAGEFQSAISTVVSHDVRGTRRWEAAQAELHEMRTSLQGRRHDIGNILTGVDGTLMVLADQRRCLREEEVDGMITAVRQEVQWLQLVVGEGVEARSYDASELLSSMIDVRRAGRGQVLANIEPDLVVQGRPDRLALAVDNLLVNVAVHAPDARATLAAHRLRGRGRGDMVEVVVSDHGPGLQEAEFELARQRGWRSCRSADRPGSGLGLAQVDDLVAAEGGQVFLEPTRRSGRTGVRGLTVRLRLPVRQAN